MTSATYLDWNDLDITNVSPQFNDRLHAGNSSLNILVNQVSPAVNQSNQSNQVITGNHYKTAAERAIF